MNKLNLTEKLAVQLNIPTHESSSIVNTILEAMTESLVKGENVEIRGFGSFSVRHYGSYEGRNPKTGEVTLVQPKKLPVFKVGKDLREKVNAAKNN